MASDVAEHGLILMVFAEWYQVCIKHALLAMFVPFVLNSLIDHIHIRNSVNHGDIVMFQVMSLVNGNFEALEQLRSRQQAGLFCRCSNKLQQPTHVKHSQVLVYLQQSDPKIVLWMPMEIAGNLGCFH